MKQKLARRLLALLLALACLHTAAFAAPNSADAGQRIQRPLPVLMYHDVTADGEELSGLTVSVSKLRRDFDTLRNLGCTPVLPRDLKSGNPLPERPVMITFDDGYLSNYRLLYPVLQEYGFKAVICPIVVTAEAATDNFCNWEQYREMEASGLVEVGSHTYDLHNPWSDGVFVKGGANGVQRRLSETDEEYEIRVLDDIRKSYTRITEELGHPPLCFAYPYGADDPLSWELLEALFPVSLLTLEGNADLSKGTIRLPRWTVTQEEPVSAFLKDKLWRG